ncbi:MAG: LysR family transcriptional regulator [Rubrivivax sp.]|jgi:LysR family transcriptional regulator of abg operon|nr:LysR family transcriptional regulator [Rubrivivax sp.]MCL4697723.1 LysR family transcriptional regulator [Burkholderiaceae bacterium]NUP86867.1 LysR family transcriptional regulator [Burkholderiaceae bacterium]
MRLKQLEEFVAVVQAGSVRGAARKLGTTQPALTKALQRLEEEIGSPLLLRSGRGVSLTAFGRALLPHAEAVQAELQRAADDLEQLRGGPERSLSVSVTPVAGITIIPEALRLFRREFPDVLVSVLDGLSPPGISLLKIGAVDFYVGSAKGAQDERSFGSMQLAPNEIVVACRPGHPLQKATRLGDLVQAQWAFTGKDGFRGELLDDAFEHAGLPKPTSVTHCASFTTLLSVVEASDLLALIPSRILGRGPFGNVLVPLTLPEMRLEISPIRVVWKAANALTPGAKAFINALRQASR